MKKSSDPSGSTLLGFTVALILVGSTALGLGWSAQSQGILWHAGRNARTGTETDTPVLSWVIYGVLLILAGIFRWKWLSRRMKR